MSLRYEANESRVAAQHQQIVLNAASPEKKARRGSDELLEPAVTVLKQFIDKIEAGNAKIAVLDKKLESAQQELASIREEKTHIAAQLAGVKAKREEVKAIKEEALAKKAEIRAIKAEALAKKEEALAQRAEVKQVLSKAVPLDRIKQIREERARQRQLAQEGTPPQTPQNNLLQS